MKSNSKKSILLFGVISLFLTSCTFIVDPVPGPHGRPGKAFFGIDYDRVAPYSYWDNNLNIPENPVIGAFYPTNGGIFDFEYFINPYEYWYGTYEIFRNLGGPGQPDGVPGYDGRDSYLLLIVNPEGFYQEFSGNKTEVPMGETIIIEKMIGNDKVKIKMTKISTAQRPTTNEPKYLNHPS